MQETKKYDYLDALRGIAIFLVLLSHIHYIGVHISDKFSVGLIGVPLFFIVSAYTLSLSQASKGFYVGWINDFFIKRIFRIVPLLFITVLVTYILGKLGIFSNLENFKNAIYTWPNLLAHLTFTYGFFVDGMNTFRLGEWSLFNESIFYILFAFLAPFLLRSFKYTLYALSIALGMYGAWNIVALLLQYYNLIQNPGWFTYVYHFPFYHFVDFSLGFLLFSLHKKYLNYNFSTLVQYILSLSLIAISTIVVIAYSKGLYINHLIWLIIFTSLVFCLSKGFPILRLLTNQVFIYLGKISYSIYLLNLPILSLVGYYLPISFHPIIRVGLSLAALLCVCSLTYRYELYWISKGSMFIKRYLDK